MVEKVIATLRAGAVTDGWTTRLCGQVADDLLNLGLPGLTVHARDAPVRDAIMTLATLRPPVQAFVSLWTEQHYGEQMGAALDLLSGLSDCVAAYLVTESTPIPPPPTPWGERTPGLANMALLRRPANLDEATWLSRWYRDHTPVAIETQATFGYVQNYVVRALTPGAPPVSGIVEELFPIDAVNSLHAFFGAADDADLRRRMERMLTSTAAFGANLDVDVVPTSRYLFRTPLHPSQLGCGE